MKVTEEQEYILDRWYNEDMSLAEAILRLRNLKMSKDDIEEGLSINGLFDSDKIV